MMQEIVIILSVIYEVAAIQANIYKRGDKSCGTFNQTGSCPIHNVFYRAYVKDTLKLLLERDSWILAAASSNAIDAPPPSKSCVTITVTDTKQYSECIFNTYNHTPHLARRVRIMGYDEDDKMEVHSIGAIHSWPLNESICKDGPEPCTKYHFGRDFLHMNSALKSTTCWNPVTMKFDPYRFIISNPYYGVRYKNVPHKTQYLLLIGVSARSPSPELHVALLAEGLPDVRDVRYVLGNLDNKRKPGYFMVYYPHYLPNMTLRCAKGYNKPYTV